MKTKPLAQETVGLDRASLLKVHRLMLLSRMFEETERRLRRQQKTFFQVSGSGQEAVQAAAAMLLKPAYDWFYPYYRDRAFCLGLGIEPRDMLLQSMAKATDPSSGGREMPNHFGARELHIVNQSSPTGSQYLQAVGTAEGARLAAVIRTKAGMAGDNGVSAQGAHVPSFHYDEVVYVSGGEGSTSEGEFYEAINLASLRSLPVLFVIQDNGYAISVPVEAQTPGGSISALVRGHPGFFVEEVDGCDFLASYRVLRRAIAHVRGRKGPALVHAHVVRLDPHSDSDDDSAYRTAAEKEADRARDPLLLFEEYLEEEGHVQRGALPRVREDIERELKGAVESASKEPEPAPSSITEYMVNPVTVVSEETVPAEAGDPVTIVDAINRTLSTEMARDERIVVFGEDVADLTRAESLNEVKGKGGVFKVTSGLQRKFGEDRVFNTPLAEAGIVGRAFGLAVRDFLPVAEIQFQDYIWPAIQQIRNELSIMRWRSNNTFSVPLVIRVPIGGYLTGGGPYHSQCAESILCHCPGMRVLLPSNARDAAGLLRTALRCGDPVVFFEHKHLYRQSYARTPDPGPDYVLPLGKASIVRPGHDLTLITFGALVQRSVRAADSLASEGLDVEVVDLRSLEPYDWDTIRDSVSRTNRALVVYEDGRTHGYGAEIAAQIAEEMFAELDAPVTRVGGKDTPVPYSPVLEKACLPQIEDVVRAARAVCHY